MKQELRAAIRSILAVRHIALLTGTLAMANTVNVTAAELPVTCVSGGCAGGRFVTSGTAADPVVSGNTMTINQSSDRVTLNWSSFNVSADGRVVFNQPNANSIALNRIFQNSPSRILGAVEANGQIYLVNPNGFVFGRTARIDAAGILASTLGIDDDVFNAGLLAPEWMRTRTPVLESDGRIGILDQDGNPVLDANGNPIKVQLVVEEGAVLQSRGSGGRVMLASQEVDNAGTLVSPDGQVILAAGEKVYLQASRDPGLRGLLVEVAAGGEAWNRMTGNISAPRGNVTVAGLAVNQNGRISASTSVAANGSVRLLARSEPNFISEGDSYLLGAGMQGGRLEVGSNSRIEVLPDTEDKTTAVDDQKQLKSRIEMSAREVFMRSGSSITAPSGELVVTAASDPSQSSAYDPDARIRVEGGTRIDMSGSDVTLPMSRNLVEVELRANELRDSPAQRDGALRGQTVVIDARIGTPLADVSGALAAIPKGISERTSAGGSVVFNSGGDVVVGDGVNIDVSGGVTTFIEGSLATSKLIGADGRLYDIGEADPLMSYVGVLNPTFRRVDNRWGYIDLISAPGIARSESTYVAGSDAGSVQFAAPSMLMNGTLRADTIVGPYQRRPGKQPLGGQLIIGLPDGRGQPTPDYRAPSVTFSPAGALISVGDDAPLPPQQEMLLPVDYLSRGFTRTEIYSNGRITVPDSMPLDLADGSSLTMVGHQVDIGANIHSAGGTIKASSVLTAGTGATLDRAGVSVAGGVTLDVQGNWTNDALAARTDPFGQPTSSVLTDGGSIALAIDAIGSELVIGDQVQLLANAGAWLQHDGTSQAGNGGSITIDSNAIQGALELGESVTVQAFGTLGGTGGKFTLAAPRIEVNSESAWAQAQRLDPLDVAADLEYLGIGTSLFTDHGFSSVSLIAEGTVDRSQDGDALRIAAGTNLLARTSVLQLDTSSAEVATGRSIAGLASVLRPIDSERGPMSLSFAVEPSSLNGPDRIGVLNMQAGATISTDAGSAVTFSSVGGIEMQGAVMAQGGSINMLVANPHEANDAGYRPELGLRVGADAILDVSGTTVYRPNTEGLLTGTIYDAGEITLQANRGFVVVESGALIDISGTSGVLDRTTAAGGTNRQTIGSNAGSLSLIAAESIALNGTLRAQAGVGETGSAMGGELALRLSRQRGFVGGDSANQATYPTNPRVLRVTSEDIALGGSAPPSGLGVLRTDVIEQSGVDALTLEADGQVEFDSVALSMGRRIVIDSPHIVARNGADVSLTAPYLALGDTIGRSVATPVTPMTGTGSLNFEGEFIDAIGAVALSGAATTTLDSSGDLRLREVLLSGARSGHLQVAGDLTLRATQIYPSTLSSYTVSALGEHSTLRIESAGARGSTPLTAGGQLTLKAANIEQQGTLLAPFGSIAMNATESLVLGAGSLTSVSGAGALIPFGRVENGEWIYQAFDRTIVTTVPERRIDLQAPSIAQDANATLELKGGGDLYAYEWVPGTGGSRDALANGASAGRYAIMPSQRGQFAPYDAQEWRGSDLQMGESVYLSGIPGLEPGYYALLPARYALLPGAMLIETVANTTDILPGSVSTLADGTPVVAGYRTFGTTGLGGTRYTGFAIHSGEYARELAQYDDSLASEFFAARAERLEQPRAVSPADAGTLSLLATTSLDMQGIVNVAGGEKGRAGRVEVLSENLDVVNTLTDSPGTVQIQASVINSWRAGEVWLGATKRGENVDVISDQVRVTDGANISADEIVLLANGSVQIDSGATVTTTSAARGTTVDRDDLLESTLKLHNEDAGAAMVAVSDRSVFDIQRTTDASFPVDTQVGSVVAAAGSALATNGSLLVNAPDSVMLAGDIRARDAVWQFGSSTVRFDNTAHDDGLTINSELLARMQEAASLTVTSADAMEFSHAVSLGSVTQGAAGPSYDISDITLRAGVLHNMSGDDLTLRAGQVTMAGIASDANAPAPTPSVGSGTFSVEANDIRLGEGTLALDGFAHTALTARNDIRGMGTTDLFVAGDLDLAAARVTAWSGGLTNIDAGTGNVRITSTGTANGNTDGVLGGGLKISANNIEHSGTLFLPSGVVSLHATSNLSVGSSGVIDVSGQLVRAADRVVGSSGGTVRLASGGNLTTEAGSRINVSGATGANAGRLSLHADGTASVASQLNGGSGGSGTIGGAFDLYAGALVDSNALIANLQTAGFSERQAIQVHTGDLTLDQGQAVTARNIEWTADQGRVQINGSMVAPSTAQRSAIHLYGQNVEIGATAQLIADGAAGVRSGGDIELGSSTGSLSVASGSVISARGDELDGSLRLRAAAVGNDVAITQLAGTIHDVDGVVVEAVHGYDVSAAPSTIEFDAIRNDLTTYMSAAGPGIRGRLDSTASLGLRVEAGVELRHDGDLTLGDLNLASWRFDGDNPIALTVRASGSINVNGDISDGFTVVNPTRTNLMNGNSATLRFAAGADLAAANPSSVLWNSDANLTLGTGSVIRTGTGDVRVSAAQNVIFNTGSGTYTGGVNGAPADAAFAFADRGGNVSIYAGNDVIGSPISQSVTDWQRRQGTRDGAALFRQTQWGTEIARFGWNTGTLGGGDLSVVAGNNIDNLSAAVADSAVERTNNELTYYGGGAMSIEAGGDVNSAVLYVARSEGRVHADGALGSARDYVDPSTNELQALGSMLMLGDARISMDARQDVLLEAIANPTALRQVGALPTQLTSFFTYGNNSAVDVRSRGGDVQAINTNAFRLYEFLGRTVVDNNTSGLRILPSSLTLMSMVGDLNLAADMTLFPSDFGQLDLFAGRDIAAALGSVVTMSDGGAGDFFTPLLPGTSFDYSGLALSMSARHQDDTTPAYITAGRDIVDPIFQVAKTVKVAAGRDIVNTTLRAQNLRLGDVTSVSAGRDLRFTPDVLVAQMSVGGPGRFDVITGRNLDLGFSGGLTTTGRLLNPDLSEGGADLNVLVGMGRDVDGNGFVDKIIAPADYLDAVDRGAVPASDALAGLRKYMVARTGNSNLTYAEAVAQFKALDSSAQRPILFDAFYAELVATGRDNARDPSIGYDQGYAAIDALFPGSRPEEGAQSPFEGDLTLAFSRIYTLAGGDINISVPGGLVNVGLANPPASIQSRPPSELGIVAQRAGNIHMFTNDDVLVNQSRVFTLLGGDIAIWSTVGDIDAGRGAKSSVSAPPPAVLVDSTGRVTLDFSGAVAGSGIRTIQTDKVVDQGDVYLMAPEGVINTGDAGVGSAGNAFFAAQQVVGNNIDFGGVAVGAPTEASGLGASLAGASAAASSASKASSSAAQENDESDEAQQTLAQTALSWLEVFVIGLGEENCKTDDLECLKRQPLN